MTNEMLSKHKLHQWQQWKKQQHRKQHEEHPAMTSAPADQGNRHLQHKFRAVIIKLICPAAVADQMPCCKT